MASPEYNIETLAIALLASHATFSGVTITHEVEDDNTASNINRISVACDPSTPKLEARRQFLGPKALQATITITARSKDTESNFDGWRDAIDEAMNSAPAGVITTATSLFPNGILIIPATGGDITQDDRRSLTRVFTAIYQP